MTYEDILITFRVLYNYKFVMLNESMYAQIVEYIQ